MGRERVGEEGKKGKGCGGGGKVVGVGEGKGEVGRRRKGGREGER